MWQFSNICAISNLEIAFTSVSASLDYIEAANSDGYVSYCDQKIEFNKSPILAVFGQIITLLAYFWLGKFVPVSFDRKSANLNSTLNFFNTVA